MNIVPFFNTSSRLMVIALVLAGCSKPPQSVGTEQPLPTKPAAAYTKEGFRSIDGQQELTFISSSEVELRRGNEITLCTYSKELDTFRIIADILGSKQVLYYDKTQDGLVARDGILLISLPELCRRSAVHIAIACVAYSNDHNDDYPPTLFVLVPQYLPKADMLRNPLTPISVKKTTGWEYFPGNVFRDLKENETPREKVLLRSLYPLNNETVCTAFYDAHVEFRKK